jgi:hypothetical protein
MTSTNNPNHQQKSYVECNPKGPLGNVNLDQAPPYCSTNNEENLRAPNDETLNWLKDQTMKKTGFGSRVDCDPAQRGYIVNDLENVDRSIVYRYSKSIRGTDEAILDVFRNVIVIDEDGKAWPIPVILGTPEKAVAAIVQDNVRKDETLVVDRIKLPIIAITQNSIDYDLERYSYHKAVNYFSRSDDGKPGFAIKEKYTRDTVFGFAKGIPVNIGYTITAWTMYQEDMNQIIEQILTKFSQVAYIRVTGIPWEIIVTIDSIANNVDQEPGDSAIKVIKYEFSITAKSYICQPITRQKAVLKARIDFVDGLSEETITEVLASIEESVKELEC